MKWMQSSDSLLYPSVVDLLFRGLWQYIPTSILRYVEYIPTREYIRFRAFRGLARSVSKGLVEEKASVSLVDATNRDIMSVLGKWALPDNLHLLIYDVVQANVSVNPEHQLNEDEILSQMA